MINQVSKGDSLAIKAQDWNLIADTANAFAQGEILSSRQRDHKHAGSQQTLYFSCENEVKFGRAVHIDGTDADFSEADIQYDSPILKGDLTFNDVGQPFAIATTGAAAGDLVEIALHGQVLIYCNLTDTDHNYAKPKENTTTGEIESCVSGPIKLLTKGSSTGNQWCLALLNQFSAPPPENPYTIDRTDPSDDSKAWDVANNEPSDWADYDGVELITGTIRLNNSTLEQAKVKRQWPASIAPVIPALESGDIEEISDDFSCPE